MHEIIRIHDRVRYIDPKKDEEYGVLQVFAIKGEYATCFKGDFENFGQMGQNIKLKELRKI